MEMMALNAYANGGFERVALNAYANGGSERL